MIGDYVFFACWLVTAIVLGLGLYYAWNTLERRKDGA